MLFSVLSAIAATPNIAIIPICKKNAHTLSDEKFTVSAEIIKLMRTPTAKFKYYNIIIARCAVKFNKIGIYVCLQKSNFAQKTVISGYIIELSVTL